MKLSKININPKSLAFVTTDKCTASCHNCCFKCNPKNNKRLKLEEILSIIDQVVEDFPSVESCVFTGGECTLLKGDLAIAIEHASKKKLSCRIVSNGFLATNEKVAHSFLAKLHNKGLSELNLSTGDEHQKWIPYKNIINACKAALKENILVAINVESTSNSHFTSQNLLEDPEIKEAIYKNKIILKDSLWIEFDKTNSSEQAYIPDKKGCSYLFNTISISPDMHLLACCGLTCQENKILDLGNLNKYPIKVLWNEQFDDLVKLWLFTDGPHEIHNYLCKKGGCDTRHEQYPHMCSMCLYISNDTKNMEIIKNNIHSILPSVLLKYKCLT